MISAQIIEATYILWSMVPNILWCLGESAMWRPKPFLKLACMKLYMIGNKFLLSSKVIAFKGYVILYIKLENCIPYVMLSHS